MNTHTHTHPVHIDRRWGALGPAGTPCGRLATRRWRVRKSDSSSLRLPGLENQGQMFSLTCQETAGQEETRHASGLDDHCCSCGDGTEASSTEDSLRLRPVDVDTVSWRRQSPGLAPDVREPAGDTSLEVLPQSGGPSLDRTLALLTEDLSGQQMQSFISTSGGCSSGSLSSSAVLFCKTEAAPQI